MRLFALIFAAAMIGTAIPFVVVAWITSYYPYTVAATLLYYVGLAIVAGAIYVGRGHAS